MLSEQCRPRQNATCKKYSQMQNLNRKQLRWSCCCCSKVLRRHMAHRPSTSFMSVLYNLAKWLFLYSVYFSSLFFHFFYLIFFLWPTGFFSSRICFFVRCSSFFPISTYTIIYNRAIYNGSNNMWTYLHSDLLTLYISIIKTIYNYTLNMNLYNVHPYIYLHVYAPNAYDTISLTLSFDKSITTVEQVN